MPERVFLTDRRREVLDGEFVGSDETLYSHKSRIRSRARMALSELVEVAQSDEIDNSDVFDPGDLARLVAAVLSGDQQITPRWNFDGTDAEYRDQYGYQIDTCWRLEYHVNGYADQFFREVPPGPAVDDPDLIEDE